MKAVILAGGYATRLWPITKTKPKPLLPVGKKRIIDFIIEKLEPLDIDIIVSTNKRFEDDFREWSMDKDVELIIEDTTSEEEKLGAVRALSEQIKNIREDIFLIAGDNLFSFSLEPIIDYYREVNALTMAVYDLGNPELVMRYSEVEMDDGGRVTKMIEKPERPKTSLVGIGIYMIPGKDFELITEYVRENSHADNLGSLISWMIGKTDVYGFRVDGDWYDVGNPDTYLESTRIFMDHHISPDSEIDDYVRVIPPCVIEENATIKGRSIIGPYAYIDRECFIENSDVSECVVFRGTTIRNSTIWRSIIDEKCEIRNLELRKSIVGGHAKIQRGE